jgi:SAM-dependent methyltransferase
MSLVKYHTKCRACGNDKLSTVLDLGNHYLHGLFAYPDFSPPTTKIPTKLIVCNSELGGCGLVQLANSVDSDILYSRYGYRSGVSATMRKHLHHIASKALNTWWEVRGFSTEIDLPSCLDIGCNDGYLLSHYPAPNKKTGIDPCDIGRGISNIKNFSFINDSYPSKKLEGKTFDIITMIACFYDLNNPVEVAKELRKNLSDDGILVVEVSYWPTKMAKNAIDEVCHEHVCFYNLNNLEMIFGLAGLKIFDVQLNDINGGSVLLWMTPIESNLFYFSSFKHNQIVQIKFNELNDKLHIIEPYIQFEQRCSTLANDIKKFLLELNRQGKKIHLYGASTKGNVLLQYIGLDNSIIPFAAERSEEKVGGWTLGTNIKMISEEESRSMRPDFYFVPIWSFKDEIVERENRYLSEGGKLIFPIPKLEIIGK